MIKGYIYHACTHKTHRYVKHKGKTCLRKRNFHLQIYYYFEAVVNKQILGQLDAKKKITAEENTIDIALKQLSFSHSKS